MISLSNTTKPQVRFNPRAGFRRTDKSQEFDLIYGHTCPACGNVIQAFFYTDKPVKLWPYEETTVLSQGEKNMGEVLKVVPDEKYAEEDSCYRSYFYPPTNGNRGGQRIILKNHLIQVSKIDEADGQTREPLWEVGERACPLAGVFAMREDLVLKDAAMLLKMTTDELAEYNLPDIKTLIPDPKGDSLKGQFKWTPAVGQAPPMILMSREIINQGFAYWLKKLLVPYKKPAVK